MGPICSAASKAARAGRYIPKNQFDGLGTYYINIGTQNLSPAVGLLILIAMDYQATTSNKHRPGTSPESRSAGAKDCAQQRSESKALGRCPLDLWLPASGPGLKSSSVTRKVYSELLGVRSEFHRISTDHKE